MPVGVLVPGSAIAGTEGELFVWVVQGDDMSRRNVDVSDKIGSRVLIIAGLRSGERVVTELNAELQLALEEGAPVSVLN